MKLVFSFLSLLLLFSSCKKDISISNNDTAFFGGEIVNPVNDFVVIYKSNKLIDTIALDQNNRFLYKLETVEPGLYRFTDGNEYQNIILEPNDSIMLRLNTLEFDESLVFTGRGAKKNNYLMNMYLDSETDDKFLLEISQLPPSVFENKLDSLHKIKEKKLKAYEVKHNTSALFNKIAKANINYTYYSTKEAYPFTNFGNNERDNFKSLPKDFYAYRDKINYNDELLNTYYPYRDFLESHFNNMALQNHFKNSSDNVFNKVSLPFNLEKQRLINEKIESKKIKNRLLIRNMFGFVINSKNIDDYDTLLKSFIEKCDDSLAVVHSKRHVASYKRLKSGSKLPNFDIVSIDDKEVTIRPLINKPTVIYFWSSNYRNHFIDSHNKAKELKTKYPEINFIALNVDGPHQNLWKNILKSNQFSSKNEFRLKELKTKRLLSVNPINKVILVDKHMRIANAKANMFGISFEQELLGLINK